MNVSLVAGQPQCVWPAAATLGEGTLWSQRLQVLYWVDILGHQLHRYHPATGAQSSWSFDEEISAVAERAKSSSLLVTLRRGFAFFDPETGDLQRLLEPEPDRTNNRFNDGKCDSQGNFWGGTMDFDGQAATGALTHKRLWLRFAPNDGYPDGMTTDAQGRLWIAHWGAACVTCHDPISAAELARITLPTSHITNCAFGGPDLRTLFITSACSGLSDTQRADQPLAGGLFSVEMNCQGLSATLLGDGKPAQGIPHFQRRRPGFDAPA